MPPIPFAPVSGRYVGRQGSSRVELRVDVDGPRTMLRVSADYFHVDDDGADYRGSMCVDRPAIGIGEAMMTISGRARSGWTTDTDRVSVTIPRVTAGAAPADVTLCHLSASGAVRARYRCAFTSAAFREVQIEEDVEQGVTPFSSYDTSQLPAGCEPRTLTHLTAFRDAGIEMVRTRDRGALEHAAVPANASWSDAELHAAMERNFSLFSEREQWAIWLLHARLHDRDRGLARPTLFGLMFDKFGAQRQGCALFYQGMRGTSPERRRIQLFTGVHELAHGFNLLHSFQKSLARPPVPSRPGSATWMAYPDLFPGGHEAFWPRFEFQFDDEELVHLRHAMLEDVIMGGRPFEAGAAFEDDAATEATPTSESGLRLTISGERSLTLGVPVSIDMRLDGTTRDGCPAPTVLGPRPGNVDVAIRGPDSKAIAFEPFLRHCRLDDATILRAGDRPRLDTAFIHYGKAGFAFDRPGRYEVRARLNAPGGRLVLSNVLPIVVRPALTTADRGVAQLAFGEQQGALMSLVGSDAPQLRGGDDALRTIVERYPRHPMASFVRLVRATNDARAFKRVGRDGRIHARAPRPTALAEILRVTRGVERLQRATLAAVSEAKMHAALTTLLPTLPTDPATERVVDPFVRARASDITVVMPRALSMLPAPPPSTRRPARTPAYRRGGRDGYRDG